MSELAYKPSEWGKEFHGLQAREALGAGSAGPGKTTVLMRDADPLIVHEHARCKLEDRGDPRWLEWGASDAVVLYLRRTSSMLDQLIAKNVSITGRIDPGARWTSSSTGGTHRLSSGLRMQYDSCRDITSYERFMSKEFTRINWDELNQFDEEQYDNVRTRVRTSDKYLRRFLANRAMSNPVLRREGQESFVVRDPYWVRDYFIEPHPKGRKLIRTRLVRRDGRVEFRERIYLPATLYDNPDKDFVEDYELTLLDTKPAIRAALLYGDWYLTPDSYYSDDWDPTVHICRPFKIPRHWHIFRTMDWGFKNHGCIYWIAVDENDTLFAFRELTFLGKLDREVAKEVVDLEKAMGIGDGKTSPITGPADTQLWEKRGDTAGGDESLSKAEVFARMGVSWVPCTKARARSAELLSGRFRRGEILHTEPGIRFFNTCTQAIKTIPSTPMDTGDPDSGPVKTKAGHWHEAILYGVAYWEQMRGGDMRVHSPGFTTHGDVESIYEEDDERGQWGFGIAI